MKKLRMSKLKIKVSKYYRHKNKVKDLGNKLRDRHNQKIVIHLMSKKHEISYRALEQNDGDELLMLETK